MDNKNRNYTCEEAHYDIEFFFSSPKMDKGREEVLFRALEHMTQGTTVEKHNISCQPCWDFYMEMKRQHCGG